MVCVSCDWLVTYPVCIPAPSPETLNNKNGWNKLHTPAVTSCGIHTVAGATVVIQSTYVTVTGLVRISLIIIWFIRASMEKGTTQSSWEWSFAYGTAKKAACERWNARSDDRRHLQSLGRQAFDGPIWIQIGAAFLMSVLRLVMLTFRSTPLKSVKLYRMIMDKGTV